MYLENAQKFNTMGDSKEVRQESKILNYTGIVDNILIASTALEIKAVSQSYHKIYCQVIRRRLFSRKRWGHWSLFWKKKKKPIPESKSQKEQELKAIHSHISIMTTTEGNSSVPTRDLVTESNVY